MRLKVKSPEGGLLFNKSIRITALAAVLQRVARKAATCSELYFEINNDSSQNYIAILKSRENGAPLNNASRIDMVCSVDPAYYGKHGAAMTSLATQELIDSSDKSVCRNLEDSLTLEHIIKPFMLANHFYELDNESGNNQFMQYLSNEHIRYHEQLKINETYTIHGPQGEVLSDDLRVAVEQGDFHVARVLLESTVAVSQLTYDMQFIAAIATVKMNQQSNRANPNSFFERKQKEQQPEKQALLESKSVGSVDNSFCGYKCRWFC